jgi:hypothetical protein
MTKTGGWRDNFACGCSDESRAKAEAVLREVFPKLDPGEEKILTGKKVHYRYEDQHGKVLEGDRDEHRPCDLTESCFIAIADLAEERGFWIESITYAFDQWAGMTVTLKTHEERGLEPVRAGSQLDFGLMPHALAMILRDLEAKLDEVSPGRFEWGGETLDTGEDG